MHTIEPFYNWKKYYQAEKDPASPFYGNTYSNQYEDTIYGYFIDPEWDYIGSETLYCKLLFTDYTSKTCIIELFGEWNDALHNDSMHLKRTVIDPLLKAGISKFILIADNLLQFHGGETDYYEEWLEEVEDGWIAALNLRPFILAEFEKYSIDYYINCGGTLALSNWRTHAPFKIVEVVDLLLIRRLGGG